METSYMKWDSSEQVNVLMEEQNRTPKSKGFHISEFFKKEVIYCVILGIGFLFIIALLSQSLRNESKMFKEIEMGNTHSSDPSSQMFFNLSKEVSKEVSGIGLKIDLLHKESRNESSDNSGGECGLHEPQNYPMEKLEPESGIQHKKARMISIPDRGRLESSSREQQDLGVKDLMKEALMLKAGQMTKQNTIPSLLEEVAKLREENRKIAEDVTQVLEGLTNLTATQMTKENLIPSLIEEVTELRETNRRIAEDATQVLEGIRNLTEFSCTKCPPNWVPFEKSCYFFSMLSKPWMVAKQLCENEGAHLVIIDSHQEMKFLVSQTMNDQVFWIGLSDTGKEGEWIWEDGTPLTFSFWGTGEPNNAGDGEDCATLRFTGKWNDALCSVSEKRICERKC